MRLAIIGSYGHVGVVLAGLAEAGGVELAAAARWGPEDPLGFLSRPARGNARRLENLPVYGDAARMLEEVRPDLAAVFTPLHLLAEHSTAAVEAGCHVISEKPLATTLEGLGRLRRAVDRAGVEVAAMFTARGEPAFRTLRKAVLEGRVGEPIYAAAQKSYPFAERDEFYKTRETYGGTIPWVGIHAIDYIHYCTGLDYRRVAAIASNMAHPSRPGMEDQGGLLAELSNGGAAVINFDYLRPWGRAERPWGDDRLRVAGTEGVIETRLGAPWSSAPDESPAQAMAVELITPDSAERLPLEPARNVFADFVASLEGKAPAPVTTDESFRMTEVALKARDAQDSGRFVAV